MPKSWNILADRVRPQNNVGVRFLDNDIFLRLTAPSSCSTRLPNDQDHLQEIAQLFLVRCIRWFGVPSLLHCECQTITCGINEA